MYFDLWVYFKPSRSSAEKIINALESVGGSWQGDGCCTRGLADISWTFSTLKSAQKARDKVVALSLARRILIFKGDEKIEDWALTSHDLNGL